MKKKTFLLIAIPLITLSLVWLVITPILFPITTAGSQGAAAHPGFLAPDFTLSSPTGESVTLSDYHGQPVLVFLWASWCSVCKGAMPGLQTVYEAYAPQGFELLAVNMTTQDSAAAAEAYFASQGYTYPMLLDAEGAVASAYQMHALPTAVLVDPDGTVLDVVIGSGMSAGFLQARLDEIFNNVESE